MAIFNEEELGVAAGKFISHVDNWLSDSLNFIVLSGIVWVGLLVIGLVIIPTSVFGINEWWIDYSSANPGVQLETTVAYWVYMISLFIYKAIFFLQSLYLLILVILYITRPPHFRQGMYKSTKLQSDPDNVTKPLDLPKKYIVDHDIPKCPVCRKFDKVVKKGERNGNQRYFCKRDQYYFQKLI